MKRLRIVTLIVVAVAFSQFASWGFPGGNPPRNQAAPAPRNQPVPPSGIQVQGGCAAGVSTPKQTLKPEEAFRADFAKADLNKKRSMISGLATNKTLAKLVMKEIEASLTNKDLASAAAATVGKLGSDVAGSAIPQLGKILNGDFPKNAKSEAIKALGNMKDKSSSEIPQIMAFISTDGGDQNVRREALTLIGKFGAKAESVLPDLEELAHYDKAMQASATAAMSQIKRDIAVRDKAAPGK